MNSPCVIATKALPALRQLLGVDAAESLAGVEVEFKEIPYFIVARGRQAWDHTKGDINTVQVLGVNERGLVVDPDAITVATPPKRFSFVPWSNILSLTISSAEGSKTA